MDVTRRPLLTVFVLTAIATALSQLFPVARELALLLDSIPLIGVVALTVIATVRRRRESVPLSRLVVAVYCYFAGSLIGTLGVAHLVAVVLAAIDRGRHQQFVYNFHFYSLVLLGALLIVAGLMAAVRAVRLAPGARAAWLASLSI